MCGAENRKESQSDFVNINVQSIAYVPHALPMFRAHARARRRRGESFTAKRKDPLRTKIPPGADSEREGGTLLTQHHEGKRHDRREELEDAGSEGRS